MRLLLERGEFTTQSTALTTFALAFYSLGLIGHSAVEIQARAFSALHDTRTPVIIGVGAMALNVVLSMILRGRLAHGGLALANTIATTLEMVLLFALLARRIGGLDWKGLWATIGKTAAASAVMAAVLIWASSQWAGGSKTLVGIGGLLVGAPVFLGVALALRTPEMATLRRLLPRRR